MIDLDTLIVTVFASLDDLLEQLFADKPLRERGARPTLFDSEVVTIEIIGEYLGFEQDKPMFEYFRRHSSHFFPALKIVN